MLRPNWDVQLCAFASEVRGEPFAWGRTDCANLSWRALAAVWEPHPLPPLPAYNSRHSAVRAFRAMGAGVGAHLRAHGAVRVKRACARAGDVVLMHGGHSLVPRIGVVVSTPRMMTSNPDEGVVLVDLHHVAEPVTCWRLNG